MWGAGFRSLWGRGDYKGGVWGFLELLIICDCYSKLQLYPELFEGFGDF